MRRDYDDVVIFLRDLTDMQLANLPTEIGQEWTRRLQERLKPGMLVKTIQSGFDGAAGRVCVFQGFVNEGDGAEGGAAYGDRYARFGLSLTGKTHWLVEPHKLGEYVRIVDEPRKEER